MLNQIDGLEQYQFYLHLSKAQIGLLLEFAAIQERPEFKTYLRFEKLMRSISPKKLKKKERQAIPNTRLGTEENIKLESEFDARRDLPEGFGVFPRYDSGSNYALRSAGLIVLTDLWNWYWVETTNEYNVKKLIRKLRDER